MSGETEAVDTSCCASCGISEIDDIKLMPCDDCDLVRYYCSDECRENHKSEHEEDCKKRAAELRDELLFKQPEGTHLGDCPICMIPMPLHPRGYAIYACCGKYVCNGCFHANNTRGDTRNTIVPRRMLPEPCPFCRNPDPSMKSKKLLDKQLMKRAEKNDPAALCLLGGKYEFKGHYSKAFECYTKAVELGDITAHYLLSTLYYKGKGVEKDEGKGKHHLEEATIGGYAEARYTLAFHELNNGNYERAVKHSIIAATQGLDDAMKTVMEMFKDGFVQKEVLAATLRAHKATVDATKSPQRQAAEDFHRNHELLYGPHPSIMKLHESLFGPHPSSDPGLCS